VSPGKRCEKKRATSPKKERSDLSSKLLQEGEGDHLRVGETLEGSIMLRFGVKEPVDVVYEAKQDY